MNRQLARTALAAGGALLACATLLAQDVKYNYAMGTNFSKYKTYTWMNLPSQVHPDQIVDQQIHAAFETALASKGFTKSASGTGDMQVGYQIAVSQEKQWNAYGMGGGLRFGGMGSATSSTINVGTLVFDVFDPAAKQQIWTGEAGKTIDPSNDPQKNQKNLQKAIDKLLKNFPPQQK